MRTSLITATLLAGLLAAMMVASVHAQRPGGQPPSQGIAVIDVTYILKNHARFNGLRDSWNRDFENFKATVKKDQETIAKSAERLKQFHPGTPEYKKLEEELTQKQSDLNVKAQLQQKEFGEREAKILYTVQQEIKDAVRYYCERSGTYLVLQFNGEPVDPNNPQSIDRGLRQLVVHQQGIDITPVILDELNRRAANPGVAGRPPAQPVYQK